MMSSEIKIILQGIPASGGKIKGKVSIVKSISKLADIERGNILVAPYTNPLLTVAIFKASAIVTEQGGITSHAATIAREVGIPCVVGANNATTILKEDMEVIVDGYKGIIYG